GLRVTINTDNRLITRTTVSDELHRVHTALKVPFGEMKLMVLAGFKSAFLPFHDRQAAVRKASQELALFDDRGVRAAPKAAPSPPEFTGVSGSSFPHATN